jgi:hypothetical protein
LICTNNADELSRQLRSCSSAEQTACLSNLSDSDKAATLLMYAAFYGNMSICQLLLDTGATLHTRDNEGRNVLFYAIAGQAYHIAQHLIESALTSCDAETRKNFINNAENTGETCLHEAVKVHAVSCIELLLKHEIDVNIMNKDGVTALHRAVDLGKNIHRRRRHSNLSFRHRSSRYRSSASQIQSGVKHKRRLWVDTASRGIGAQRRGTGSFAGQSRCSFECHRSSGPFSIEMGA